MDQNKLLLSKEYDYSSQVEIIDISPSQNLSYDFIELCKDKNFINEECLKKGYIIEEDTSKDKDIKITNNKYNFIYYIIILFIIYFLPCLILNQNIILIRII